MRRLTQNTWVGMSIIFTGILDITMYSSVDIHGIDLIDIIGTIISLIGGILLIRLNKVGWILSTIYALKFGLSSLYNLLMDYPMKGYIITFMIILAIGYLNLNSTKYSMNIKIKTQFISLVIGALLALGNIIYSIN